MSGQGISQLAVYAVVLVALAYPLGAFMARMYNAVRLPGARWSAAFSA